MGRDHFGHAPKTVLRNRFERSAERFWRLKIALGREQGGARTSATTRRAHGRILPNMRSLNGDPCSEAKNDGFDH
jgi:hypothetical protein